MEKEQLMPKLKLELKNLTRISDKQFSERFSTSKYEDRWQDELFNEYQTQRIRVDLLIELIETA